MIQETIEKLEKKGLTMRKYVLITIVVVLGLLTSSNGFCGQKKDEITDIYKEVELFADAISILRSNYVQPIEPKKLIYGALKGMAISLDEYSQFMEPDSYSEMKEDTKGAFGGLGIEIGLREGMLTIISPMDGTPAQRAGILPKDIIVKIDGTVTRNMSLGDAVGKLRGKRGTSVDLTIWREAENKFLDVTIVRDIIKVKSIKKSEILEGNIGYVKLVEFQETTAKELAEALKTLKGKEANGLILDLRNNAGGLLNSAIDVSDLLLKKGDVIVSTKGRNTSEDKLHKSLRDSPYRDIVAVILINEGSASASEIVAGAIKDNGRGILVGQKTFGKGSVQTVIPLKDGSALRVTTAEYFTPGGSSIQKIGIIPDIIVELKKPKKDKKVKDREKEVFDKLKGDKKEKAQEVVDIDNQMKVAIDVIKTMNICKKGDSG